MFENNQNNASRDCSAEMVSYIYGETVGQEKTEFEAHLRTCSDCAEEFAGFNSVRFSISEWTTEFSAIETPAFVFPTGKLSKKTETVAAQPDSWFDGVRKLFAVYPFRAGVAFAALALCLGLAIFVFNFSGSSGTPEIAVSEINKNTAPSVLPTIEKALINSNQTSADENVKPADKVENSPKFNNKNSESGEVLSDRKLAPVSKNPVVKVSANSRKTTIENESTQNSTDSNTGSETKTYNRNKKPMPATSGKAPNLIEDEDTEDNSVRLADLFDEIDTK